MELMKQKQYSPLSVAETAVTLYAVDKGFVDDIALDKIGAFEDALHSFMNSSKKDLMTRINQTGDYSDEIESGLKSGIAEFKKNHTW